MAAETIGGPTIIIELGLDRGEPETYAMPTRATVPIWLGPLLIAVLVLFSSAASAAPPPPPLSQLLSVQVGPADSYTITDGGQLLAQNFGRLGAYDLGSGALRWEIRTIAPTYRLRTGSGVVLLRPSIVGADEPSTIAVSLASGAVRWQRQGSVMTVPGSPALLSYSGVRSVSGYGRRVQGPVESLDPATGQTRWRVEVPSTAVLLGVPGPAGSPPRMLLVGIDGTFSVHDLDTGALLTSATLPAADYATDNPAVSGGLIVLRHPGDYGTEVSAYDPVTLGRRWVRPADGVATAQACGALTCLAGADGVRAVDPADGTQRWIRPEWRSVQQRGNLLLASASPDPSADPVAIIDPATGRVLVELRGWRLLGGTGGDDHLLVTRVVDAGARTMVAVAAPGDPRPRMLAALPPGTGDCQAAPGRLVCRSTSGELVVWAYRQEG
jgi:outer membrane protein assembly factor BamB